MSQLTYCPHCGMPLKIEECGGETFCSYCGEWVLADNRNKRTGRTWFKTLAVTALLIVLLLLVATCKVG